MAISTEDAVCIRSDADFVRSFDARLVDDPNGCRIWTGLKTKPDAHGRGGGYGRLDFPTRLAKVVGRRGVLAHRVAWTIAGRTIPDGKKLLHSCDVRHCCRIEHLHPGTCKENTAEMIARGRLRVGAKRRGADHPNAKLTPDAVAFIRAHPEITGRALARQLSVHTSTVNRARQRWG